MPSDAELRAKAKDFKINTGGFDAAISKGALAQGVIELDKDLREYHVKSVAQKLSRRTQSNLRSSILRPQERNEGIGGRRQTGNFGPSTFQTITFGNDDGTQGFAFPDVELADQRTKYVWRTLEWGLGAGRMDDQLFASRGDFRFPNIAGWETPDGTIVRGGESTGDILRPGRTAGGNLAGGQGRGRRQGRVTTVVRNELSIEPKLFVTEAWESVVAELPRDYNSIATNVVQKFWS